jgi:hypothetical protein
MLSFSMLAELYATVHCRTVEYATLDDSSSLVLRLAIALCRHSLQDGGRSACQLLSHHCRDAAYVTCYFSWFSRFLLTALATSAGFSVFCLRHLLLQLVFRVSPPCVTIGECRHGLQQSGGQYLSHCLCITTVMFVYVSYIYLGIGEPPAH